MPTVHFKVLLDGAGTINSFLEAAVKAASNAVDNGTASVFWKAEAECGWGNVVSNEDHIKAVINARPAKKAKFQQSSSSLEVTQAPSTYIFLCICSLTFVCFACFFYLFVCMYMYICTYVCTHFCTN